MEYNFHIYIWNINFLIPYICVSTLYWSLSIWLTSLCKMGSSFILLVRTDSSEFFLMAWCICTTASLSIRLLMIFVILLFP